MKLYVVAAVLFGLAAVSHAGGHGGKGRGAERFKEFLAKPICKCDVVDQCVADKKAKMMECAQSADCTAKLVGTGVTTGALKQCFEGGKDAHKAVKACITAEIGKKCDDGSGTISEPDLESLGEHKGKGKGRGHWGGKGKGKGKGQWGGAMREFLKQLHENIPAGLKDYKKCVKQCVKASEPPREPREDGRRHGGDGEERPEGGDRKGKGGHHGGKKWGKHGHHKKGCLYKKCMKQNDCRPVMHDHDKMKAAFEKCKPTEGRPDKRAMIQEKCECLKSAGLSALDCNVPAEESGDRRKRHVGHSDESDEVELLDDDDLDLFFEQILGANDIN